jgi:hypothetical protein
VNCLNELADRAEKCVASQDTPVLDNSQAAEDTLTVESESVDSLKDG